MEKKRKKKPKTEERKKYKKGLQIIKIENEILINGKDIKKRDRKNILKLY